MKVSTFKLFHLADEIESIWRSIDDIIDDLSDDLKFEIHTNRYTELISGGSARSSIHFEGEEICYFGEDDLELFDEISTGMNLHDTFDKIIEFQKDSSGFQLSEIRIHIYVGKSYNDFLLTLPYAEETKILEFIQLLNGRILEEYPFFIQLKQENRVVKYQFSINDLD
jgi:hypothetical protein